MEGGRSLERVAVLHGLPEAERTRLAEDCRWRSFGRGAEILSAEEDSTDVQFIAAGRVRVTFYSPGGREVTFRELGAGASFGELSAIDGQSRSASVVALDDCAIAVLSRERFWRLLRDSSEVSANVLRSLATLVRDLSTRIVGETTLTVPQRVRAEIVRLARATEPKGNSALISKSPTHAELASQIGATREAVSRELSRMAGDGFVERRGRDLLVHDVASLQASIDGMREN